MNIVELTNNGLYCEAGDFYVDPWRPVLPVGEADKLDDAKRLIGAPA